MNTSGMNIAHLAENEALASLGSGPTGLADAEAARRLAESAQVPADCRIIEA